MDFAAWLTKTMRDKRVTQTEIADAVGVTRQAVNNWLHDRGIPSNDVIPKLAGYFSVTPDSIHRLVGNLPPVGKSDPWVEEMSHKLKLLSPELRSIAENVIAAIAQSEERNDKKK